MAFPCSSFIGFMTVSESSRLSNTRGRERCQFRGQLYGVYTSLELVHKGSLSCAGLPDAFFLPLTLIGLSKVYYSFPSIPDQILQSQICSIRLSQLNNSQDQRSLRPPTSAAIHPTSCNPPCTTTTLKSVAPVKIARHEHLA